MTTDQEQTKNSNHWHPIQKPAEIAEKRIIDAILSGTFPADSNLPGERELADLLGVTRPTLREVLQRLQRDGWVEIHQGKPTRVRNYWKEGKLGVLDSLASHTGQLPDYFVSNLLKVRLSMAPTYTSLAIANAPEKVVELLQPCVSLDQSPQNFANFDWSLQHELTILCENPVFVLILNGFEDLFLTLAPAYFKIPEAREHSLKYYRGLKTAAENKDEARAKKLTEEIMLESLKFWEQTNLTK